MMVKHEINQLKGIYFLMINKFLVVPLMDVTSYSKFVSSSCTI